MNRNVVIVIIHPYKSYFVMIPLNLTLHCLQPFFFEHHFNLHERPYGFGRKCSIGVMPSGLQKVTIYTQ